MNWDHDISAAPLEEPIWAASQCGKVIKSSYVHPKPNLGRSGRWSGFATGEAPIAWQRFVVPEHPFAAATTSEAALTKAPTNVSLPVDERSGERANAGGDHVTGGENAHTISAEELVSNSSAFILEDVGGGA